MDSSLERPLPTMQVPVTPWKPEYIVDLRNENFVQKFRGEKEGYVTVGPQKYFFPSNFRTVGEKHYKFKARPDDVWIVTFPRSGTTLTQELVWILLNNFDYKTASETPLEERVPFFEFGACPHPRLREELIHNASPDNRGLMKSITSCLIPTLENLKSPRFIKTHLPFSLLNPNLTKCGAKSVYVARNPKKVIVSFYHLHRLFKTLDFTGTLDEFVDFFLQDKIMWCPYWKHIEEGWQLRNNPNVLFIFYEDMMKDMEKSIARFSQFFDIDCSTEEIAKLAQHLHISNFKNNPSVNMSKFKGIGILNQRDQDFVRKGGQFTDTELSKEQEFKIDSWIKQNLKNTTLRFPD